MRARQRVLASAASMGVALGLAGSAVADELSYLSEVGEQIQQTAAQRSWLTGASQGGVIYVAFTLEASGDISRPTVMPERSSGPAQLQELAVRIVQAAAPFSPFPSGVSAPGRMVYVPLEFLPGGPQEPEVLEVVDAERVGAYNR